MEVWVLLSFAGAFLQNLRTALQKTLSGRVSVAGAVYARFVFAAPWAVTASIVLCLQAGRVPEISPRFLFWAVTGGLAQIAATLLLLYLFTLRNFAVGNTFAKTETVQAVLLGLLILGDRITGGAVAGILVSLAGVVLISLSRGGEGRIGARAIAVGLACGAVFALAGVAYRAAGLSLGDELSGFVRAGFTLAFVTVFQTVVSTLWLWSRRSGTAGAVIGQWRIGAPVGLAGMAASFCWFAAFTMASAAEVKAVGQVELLFSWLTALFVFRERPDLRETAGMLLVSAGIIVLVLAS